VYNVRVVTLFGIRVVYYRNAFRAGNKRARRLTRFAGFVFRFMHSEYMVRVAVFGIDYPHQFRHVFNNHIMIPSPKYRFMETFLQSII
jgi:hypothetical protein